MSTTTETTRDTRELDTAPSLLPLYGKAAANMALPGRGGGDGELPDLELVLRNATIDSEELADYDRVCGFRYGARVPTTYPHIQGFPLQVALMTDKAFPFAMVGLVHVENSITQHRWIDVSESLTYRVWAENLRPHAKGQQFDMMTMVESGGETVWEETSTYLRRGGGEGEGSSSEGDSEPNLPEPSFTAEWRLPSDIGRRYGSVSGDRNPIHMSALTARLFGFPKAIAHGLWTKARALASLEGRLPEAFTVEAAFKKPLLLPAKVHFLSEQQDGVWRFAVVQRDGGTPHLEGTLTPN